MTFLPYGSGHAHVMVECTKCGHVEFLSESSPLLIDMKGNAVYDGDGDRDKRIGEKRVRSIHSNQQSFLKQE